MKTKTRRTARTWHRWLGLITALPLLWLALSGILLNHAEKLGLNNQQITATWILRQYHQLPKGEPLGIKIHDRHIVAWGDFIFLDQALTTASGKLIGAALSGENLAIATPQTITIIDPTGEALDELDELSLPSLPLQSIGHHKHKLYVQSSDQWWIFSDDLLAFQKSPPPQTTSPIAPLHPQEKQKLTTALRTQGAIPLSRVILDAHSGKLFGWPATLLYDLAALSLILLTIMGLRLLPKKPTP